MNQITWKEDPNDILRPLSAIEVKNLLNLYKNHYDKTTYHYTWILNQCKINEKISEILAANGDETKEDIKNIINWNIFEKRYYTHRYGNLNTHGTFISITKDCYWSIAFSTLQETCDELRECLEKTNLIDWHSGLLLVGIRFNIAELIENSLLKRGAIIEKSRDCYCLIIKQEDALNLQIPTIPDGYRIERLSIAHAEQVHSEWPNKLEGSLEYIKGLIIIYKTFGVFRKEDNALLAWIFQYEYSGIGILQVSPEIERQGFGSILVASLVKSIAQYENEDVIAFIRQPNFKSKQLLEKIGFKITDSCKWIEYKKF